VSGAKGRVVIYAPGWSLEFHQAHIARDDQTVTIQWTWGIGLKRITASMGERKITCRISTGRCGLGLV